MIIKLSDDEIKTYEFEILKDVANFCDKNNIHYSLAFGTLLGTIRHNGFIPWDDDIDIVMPRDEYKWFVSNYKNPRFKVVDSTIDHNYPYAFGKVMDITTKVIDQTCSKYPLGLYIDIFPIDGLPQGKQEFKHRKKCEFICRLSVYKMISLKYPTDLFHRLIHIVIKVILFFINQKSIVKKQVNLSQKYSYLDSEYASILTIRTGCKNKFKKEVFLELEKHRFENDYFNIPIEYDTILSCIYGDYMTLPPKEKQIAHYMQAYKLF